MKIQKKVGYITFTIVNAKLPTIFFILIRLLQALYPSILVMVMADFVDTILGGSEVKYILWKAAWLAAAIGISRFCILVEKYLEKCIRIQNEETARKKIFIKTSRLPYFDLEQEEILALRNRVKKDIENKITDGFLNILQIVEYIIRIISLVFLIAIHTWWIGFVTLAVILFLFIFSVKMGQLNYDAFEEAEEYRREADYIGDILTKREYVLERQLFHFKTFMKQRWEQLYEKARVTEYKAQIHIFTKTGLVNLISSILALIICIVMLFAVASGTLTAGTYMALVTAAFSLVEEMSWKLSDTMQEYTKYWLYWRDFQNFINLAENKNKVWVEDLKLGQETAYNNKYEIENVELKNVTFRYPNTEQVILKQVNMRLNKGKQYVLMGINGAGKSTIVKLLSGLYDNYTGEILINGKELRTYNAEEKRKLISVIFQDYTHYQITIREFLSLQGEQMTNDKIIEVLTQLDIYQKIKRLKNGLDTPLGKIYPEGVDLSGGEWQKLVLARHILNPVPMFILDEPTSALDPVREKEVYREFGKMFGTEKSITLMVSHRLGCTEFADKIFVMENGAIAEMGSREELLKFDGLFKQMYETQKEWYDEN